MGGAQENHGLITQNAHQQSMGQGRLHGGMACGALGRHGPSIQVGHGGWVCWDFPTQKYPAYGMMFSVTHGEAGPCLRNLL